MLPLIIIIGVVLLIINMNYSIDPSIKKIINIVLIAIVIIWGANIIFGDPQFGGPWGQRPQPRWWCPWR